MWLFKERDHHFGPFEFLHLYFDSETWNGNRWLYETISNLDPTAQVVCGVESATIGPRSLKGWLSFAGTSALSCLYYIYWLKVILSGDVGPVSSWCWFWSIILYSPIETSYLYDNPFKVCIIYDPLLYWLYFPSSGCLIVLMHCMCCVICSTG